MSGCALRRWGSGTPCVKETDTQAKREMAAALAAMQAEREKQDAMWQQGEEDATNKADKGGQRVIHNQPDISQNSKK